MNEPVVFDSIDPICDYVTATDFDTLPPPVVAATKRAVLDCIAVTIPGSTAPGIREIVETLASWRGRPESSVALYGQRLPAPEAVLANVAMCHALELDDAHYPATVHPTTAAFWSAAAMAEALGGVSGRSFLTAVALGVDVIVRLGLAAPQTWDLGYHPALYSGFGAVAATGKLRGLKDAPLRHAFGIMLSQAGATVQAAIDTALVKRLQPAFNASDGIRSVLLAEIGVTGARRVLDGPFGLFQMFAHTNGRHDVLLGDLGRRFYGSELSTKRYPASRCVHGPVEGVLFLKRQHALTARDIEAVTVEVSEGCVHECGHPFDPSAPSAEVQAQFSLPYGIAAALVYGDFFIDQLQPSAVRDPAVAAVAARVKVARACADIGPGEYLPVTVHVSAKDGRQLSHTVTTLRGSPEDPLSWEEVVEERLRRGVRYAAVALSSSRVDALIETVQALDQLADVRCLFALLDPGSGETRPERHATTLRAPSE